MKPKNPTIKNLLACIPSTGMDTLKDSLSMYAALSFYFDGEDMKAAKITAIKKKQRLIEDTFPATEYQIIEHDDSFELVLEGKSYTMNVPSLNNMPKVSTANIPAFYRDAIDALSDNPEQIYSLGYQHFPAVSELVGKCLAIS